LGSGGSLAEATEEMDEARGSLPTEGYHVNMQDMCHTRNIKTGLLGIVTAGSIDASFGRGDGERDWDNLFGIVKGPTDELLGPCGMRLANLSF
jgi:hypothetical protein